MQRGKVKDFETGEILPDYPGTLSAITRVPCRSKAKGDLTAEGGGHGQEKQDAVLPALKRGSSLKEPGAQGAQLCKMGKVREGPSLEPCRGCGPPGTDTVVRENHGRL